MATQPFRFLDLPKELRLMVYERIPITNHHHTLRDPTISTDDGIEPPTITLVTNTMDTALLVACRAIYDECLPMLTKHFGLLRACPLRLIVDSPSLVFTVDHYGYSLLGYVFSLLQGLRKRRAQILAITPDYHLLNGPDLDQHENVFVDEDPEYMNIHTFVTHCALYAEARAGRSVLVCVRSHPSNTTHESIQGLEDRSDEWNGRRRQGQFHMRFDKMGWTVHGFASTEAAGRALIHLNESVEGRPGQYFENVMKEDDDEWKRGWEEGEWILNEEV